MYTANVLAFFDNKTDVFKWIALVVAALGVALLFYDLVVNIKKRKRTKLNIVALVFLSLSLVCYILTQWVLTDLPALLGFIWVFFLVAYLVCDVILVISIGRENRRKKMGLTDNDDDDTAATVAESSVDSNGDNQTQN